MRFTKHFINISARKISERKLWLDLKKYKPLRIKLGMLFFARSLFYFPQLLFIKLEFSMASNSCFFSIFDINKFFKILNISYQ